MRARFSAPASRPLQADPCITWRRAEDSCNHQGSALLGLTGHRVSKRPGNAWEGKRGKNLVEVLPRRGPGRDRHREIRLDKGGSRGELRQVRLPPRVFL